MRSIKVNVQIIILVVGYYKFVSTHGTDDAVGGVNRIVFTCINFAVCRNLHAYTVTVLTAAERLIAYLARSVQCTVTVVVSALEL